MQNQYFGDKRDYFKYDLVIFLAKHLPGVQRFTFIPMLTKDDGSGHGGKTSYPEGGGYPALYTFLQYCIKKQHRDIRYLRAFFKRLDFVFDYCPYGEQPCFQHSRRSSYFGGIPNDYLDHAVVLADPDNGLEIRTMRPSTGDRYIRYDEVKDIYLRMSESSIFVIFQYFPRVQRQRYLRRRFQELRSVLQCPFPIAISDNEIAFITLAKSSESRERVLRLLRDYKPRNDRLWVLDGFDDPKVSPT